MRKTAILLIAACLAAASCTSNIKKSSKGVTVKAADGSTVRVEVVTDDIIRVTAVPAGAKFSTKESLMVVPQKHKARFSLEKLEDCARIGTQSLLVTVSLSDGRVAYFDTDGSPISSEIQREFSPYEADGVSAWTVHQTFSSPEDEAFYGLG